MKEGHIYIYGIISPFQDNSAEDWGEVNLKQVVQQMQLNADADILKVHIRSEGGDVNEGFAIHDALFNSGKEIHTIGEGIVASIATVIFLSGSTRSMSPNAEFMVHNPWTWGEGNADELEKQADSLRDIENKIISFYSNKTGADAELLRGLMNNETYLTADQALQHGFATEIMQPLKAVATINNHNNNNMKNEEFEQKIDEKLDGFWTKLAKAFKFETPKNLVLTTGDGMLLDFGDQVQEESEIDVGMTATVDGQPADGEYVMPSAVIYVFENGVLSEIKQPEEDQMEALKEENDALKAELDEYKEKVNNLETGNAELKESNTALAEEFKNFKAEIKSDIKGFSREEKKEDPNKPVNRFEKLYNPEKN